MEKVIGVINLINGEVEPPYTPLDFQACLKHKDKPKIICKFASRKGMRNVVNNRKKLKDKNLVNLGVPVKLFINESMALAFESIDRKCRQLKKARKIKECWFYTR